MRHTLILGVLCLIVIRGWYSFSRDNKQSSVINIRSDKLITPPDTNLPFPPPKDDPTKFYPPEYGAIHLKDPKNIKDTIIYDPETNEYIYYQKIGNFYYRQPQRASFKEFNEKEFDRTIREYWKERISGSKGDKDEGLLSKIHIGGKVFEGIFGSNTIDIRPQGSAELIFGIISNRRDDPQLNLKQQRNTNFNFEEKIQMSVMAKVGDKINFGVKYNTEASFEFENEMKLAYEGDEDEIIKKIEAGNVTLPLNSTLITGSQSLFGLKTELQFGKTRVTSVISQQKGQTSTISVSGGAQTNEFSLTALDYEANKHFFISQYFYENYDRFLKNLPIINSPINITKIEVWVTNIGAATTENRNIVALTDLGEFKPYNKALTPSPFPYSHFPQNYSNDLLTFLDTTKLRNLNTANSALNNSNLNLSSTIDFEVIENARKLQPTEYTFNSRLGFISLNTTLNPDQVLAVAFQYTIVGIDSVFQVGEFSTDGINAPQCLIVKLIKSSATNTKIPLWRLMMKNVYSIGGYQINPKDFQLHVTYKDNEKGVPVGYLTESEISGVPFIRVLNMDNLNTTNDPEPDGIFDFIDNAATQGGTIESKNGRVYFPVVEPFGSYLRKKINNKAIADKYCFDSLYTMTKTEARQYPNKNRFYIIGSYKSAAGSDISLNAMNVPQGSVKVTAGGIPLVENQDYTVDYTLGRVKIINEGILNSGTPIQISLESQSLFSIQTKTLLGTHVEHQLKPNLSLGATIINLTERPLTRKVNFGDEPISNTIWGLNVSYKTKAPIITKALDLLPFYSTKTESSITFDGEFAHLIPGHSRAIGKTGTAYIDDFEGSKSSIDLKNVGRWFLASVPKGQPSLFPEANNDSTIAYGFNRALLSWYVIDPLFYRNNNLTPSHIKKDVKQLSNHYVREVLETEIFPQKENPHGLPLNIPILNLAYYPRERGPYNYDSKPTSISAGIDENGFLREPQTRWAGIMRSLETTDFEETNVEYIEFWLMDPFIYEPNHPGGYLVFNLGDISEDVLHDNRKAFENGLPTSAEIKNVDTTQWGLVPTMQAIVNAFDNNPVSRQYQDVGLDGLSTEQERVFFRESYLKRIEELFGTNSDAYKKALNDPSADNYRYFRGADLDAAETSILDRYKYYCGYDGNSPTSQQSSEEYPTSSTTLPNVEDINRDNTLTTNERYYQYVIHLRPDQMQIGQNYIADYYDAYPRLKDGTTPKVRWYQFKIPVKNPTQVIGNIQDFKSIRFMRIFLRGFSKDIVLRFATLDLVRSQWRRYEHSLLGNGEYIISDDHNKTHFEISAVNIEENGNRVPIPYVLPPGIEREINYGTTALQKMNEQSISLKVCHLVDGDARAIYKNTSFDLRRYKRLKMHIHAEETNPDKYTFNKGDLTLFIRLGSDFIDNYYEYEIPLYPVPWNVGFDREAIWPNDLALDLELQKLVELKKQRNEKMRSENSRVSLTSKYTVKDGANNMTIVGNPSLSDVQTIMIGIRNPKKQSINDRDDGQPKCAEIWLNELRLTDFDDKGGWGATARISANLADLGNLTIAGLTTTAGFGSIEQKINERQMEYVTSYDIATNLELGKFTPEKVGLKIPFHYDISEAFHNPQYNPLSPDLLLKEDLATYSSKEERDSIKKIVQDYTKRRSFNFMNVSKTRQGDKMNKVRLWDIENLDLSYAYTELYNRNIDIEYNLRKTYKVGLGYNYQKNPKNYKPFGKSKFLNKYKGLDLIKDFNFTLMPSLISMRNDIDRQYQEQLMRNKTAAIVKLEPTYMKTFFWNRQYALKYDITEALKFDYNANAVARIDEMPGVLDKNLPDYKIKRDSIITNLLNLGRITQFNQNATVNYAIPINKLPLMDWATASAQYNGGYKWNAAPLYKDSLGRYTEHPFGNTIENNQTRSLNLNANLITLYNKVPYLRNLNQPIKKPPVKEKPKEEDEENLDNNKSKKDKKKKEDENKTSISKLIFDNSLKLMMMVRNVNANFTESFGTQIPGYRAEPRFLGMDRKWNSPGWGFVFGDQRDIRPKLVRDSLISRDTMLNIPYAKRYNNNLSLRATIEPVKQFRIELTANRTYAINYQEYYRFDPATQSFRSFSKTQNGSFTITTITFNTAFVKDAEDFSNANFEKFKKIRVEAAKIVAEASPVWRANPTFYRDSLTGEMYPTGYGPTSQDVLLTAFKAAYTGTTLKNNTKLFPSIPLPNWRINYNGLSSLSFIKKYFQSVVLMHSYRSTYTIGGFATNVKFTDPDNDGFTFVRDATGNYLARYEIGQVAINEQFAPLINFDMKWVNNITSKLEIKKSRNLTLGLTNHQLTEVASNEMIIGIGYIFKDLQFTIESGGAKRSFKSDLTTKFDLSIRNNKTILRKLNENYDQISAGQKVISINFSADYQLTQRFTLRFFFDRVMNRPYISSQFPNANTNAGISIRFSLAQ